MSHLCFISTPAALRLSTSAPGNNYLAQAHPLTSWLGTRSARPGLCLLSALSRQWTAPPSSLGCLSRACVSMVRGWGVLETSAETSEGKTTFHSPPPLGGGRKWRRRKPEWGRRGRGRRPLEEEEKGQDGIGGGGEGEEGRWGTPWPSVQEASMSWSRSGRSAGPSLDPGGSTSLGSSQ